MKKKTGFSLVELIVVITIIGVISVVGLVNYGGTNRKARDNRRMSDIEKIRIALENYKQTNGTYPATSAVLVDDYLSALPTDPKTQGDYCYQQLTSYTYGIGTSMEDTTSTNSITVTGCTDYNYGVLNP